MVYEKRQIETQKEDDTDKIYPDTWIELKNLNGDLNFIYPVMIKIQLCDDNTFIADCSTFNLYSSGSTSEEALDNIKQLLVEDYQTLLEDYPNDLTKSAKNLFRLYCAFLGKNLFK